MAKQPAKKPRMTATVGGEDKPLQTFKLKSGLHIQEDFTAQPSFAPDDKDQADPIYPTRTYKAGEKVHHFSDLVDKFGQEKFELLGESRASATARGSGSHTHGDPTPEIERKGDSTFPHGQVSTGFPEARTEADEEDDPDPEVRQAKQGEEDALEREQEAREEAEETAEDEPEEGEDGSKPVHTPPRTPATPRPAAHPPRPTTGAKAGKGHQTHKGGKK